MQTKKQSFYESIINTASGFAVSLLLAYYVLPLFGLSKSFITSITVVSIFTISSIIRNYLIRRIFNKKDIVKAQFQKAQV